jgi:hypothetical protein
MPKSATNRRAALLAGLAAFWLVLTCAPTLAHATLVDASSPQGGEVSKPPELGLTRLHGPIRVKRSGSTKGVEDGQDGQALLA